MQKKIITYMEYGLLLDQLIEKLKPIKFDYVFGIPRGGLPIAVHVSHYTNTTILDHELVPWDFYQDKNVLIVDDIIDTGKTIKTLKQMFELHMNIVAVASLFKRPDVVGASTDIWIEETPEWIIFPWEPIEEVPSEYHQGVYSDLFKEKECNVL
jgi:uncharacterized protein